MLDIQSSLECSGCGVRRCMKCRDARKSVSTMGSTEIQSQSADNLETNLTMPKNQGKKGSWPTSEDFNEPSEVRDDDKSKEDLDTSHKDAPIIDRGGLFKSLLEIDSRKTFCIIHKNFH